MQARAKHGVKATRLLNSQDQACLLRLDTDQKRISLATVNDWLTAPAGWDRDPLRVTYARGFVLPIICGRDQRSTVKPPDSGCRSFRLALSTVAHQWSTRGGGGAPPGGAPRGEEHEVGEDVPGDGLLVGQTLQQDHHLRLAHRMHALGGHVPALPVHIWANGRAGREKG